MDATGIAIGTLGRNIPNTPMLGALTRVTGIVGKEQLLLVLKTRLGATMKEKVVEANVSAFEKAYASVKEG